MDEESHRQVKALGAGGRITDSVTVGIIHGILYKIRLSQHGIGQLAGAGGKRIPDQNTVIVVVAQGQHFPIRGDHLRRIEFILPDSGRVGDEINLTEMKDEDLIRIMTLDLQAAMAE